MFPQRQPRRNRPRACALRDDAANQDKAHRNRWALQYAGLYGYQTVNTTARAGEWRYTPEHGSWLNRAECEWSVLGRPCLNRRLADKQTLLAEVDAWQEERNQAKGTIDGQFSTEDARIKLKRLYPVFKEQSSG